MSDENEGNDESKELEVPDKGLAPITFQEVREFASEMKDGLLNLLDDQAKEVLSMGAHRGSQAIRKSIGGFMDGLAGEETVTACKVVKKDGAHEAVQGVVFRGRFRPGRDDRGDE